jgi:lambda family phage tail tape measure protein
LNEFTTEWAKDSDDYVASMKKINDANEKVSTPKKQEDTKRNVVESYSAQLLAEKGLFDAYQKREQLNLEMLKQKETDKTLTKNEKEMQDAINKVLNEQQRTLDEIDKKKNLIDKNKPGASELEEELDKQKTLIQFSTDFYIGQTKKVVAANQAARTEFMTGWNEAFAQYRDNAETMADAGRKSFNTIVDSMSTALENFAKTGKISFSSLAASIIQDLIAIQIKAQASKLFSMIPSIPLMGGYGGGVGSTSSYTGFGGGSGELLASADGGPLAAGQASIVGENGPEIIVPQGASTVIPNHLTGQIGGTNNITNNYINAIDTKSFEDRLYGSSGAIWAANQYATKNIATTRSRT